MASILVLRRPLLSSLLAALALLGCKGGDSSSQTTAAERRDSGETQPSVAPVDPDSPDACVACHAKVVEEWRESMHARADHRVDPIYGGMRELRMAKQGAQLGRACADCHNPRSPDDLDSPAAKHGVSCATCHNLAAIHPGKRGAQGFEFATDNTMVGARDLAPGASPVHGTGPAPDFIRDGQTLCLSCHAVMNNPQGVGVCTTGAEFSALADAEPGAANQSCVDCHMPRTEGPAGAVGSQDAHASHNFFGPHRAWYQDDTAPLAAAVEITGSLRGEQLELELRNLAGHGFPTGFPGRMVLLVAVAHDAEGRELWRNWSDNAMAESPESVLNKVYVDEDGKPTMPPFSSKLARDTRLTPGETRKLSFAVPPETAKVELSLVFRLIPPPMVKTLGLSDAPEGQPRVFLRKTITRGDG